MKKYTILGIVLLSAAAALYADYNGTNEKKGTVKSAHDSMDSLSNKKIEEKRKAIVKEATTAVRATEHALAALDSNNTKEALDALAKATGNLEIVLARDPELALAPIDVDITTYDLLTPLNDVKKLRDDVQKAIDEGDLQEARRLIKNMRSEIEISVVNVPLATYPDAIKAISTLIDKGKIEEAKIALAEALSTLVVTEHSIPLPVIRAEEMLAQAELFAEKKERNSKENDTLAAFLKNAQYQLQMAETLGYGSKKEYKSIYKQLAEIKEKTKDGKSGMGFFDTIRNSIGAIRKKIFK